MLAFSMSPRTSWRLVLSSLFTFRSANGSHGLGGGIQAAGCLEAGAPWAGVCGTDAAAGDDDGDTGEGAGIVDAGGTLTT
mmetsp:Transcript_33942/g.71279  ORF Transcript_33942/g.71279 Transcript_33942/m.71279 type:complete len:80 (+) Transcript_33942:247-486(+)